jgi:hypothetical protein
MPRSPFLRVALLLLASSFVHAAPLTATLIEPQRPQSGYFKMGSARSPSGHMLTMDSHSLRLDGEPWLPAMGEFHYTRYPATEWREELLKMKAGGIDIVSTYVFWIHHEEIEGTWDWSGQRDLRAFVETARDVGLDVVVRLGPWCHGEVRNGGLPEWVVTRKDWKVRSTDPKFLAAVRPLYEQIARQLHGLLWKDGGPVIGVQVDNEYHGPAEYLLALKSLARDVGLDVPLYTRTGWPPLTSAMPVGEIVPLFGVYAEGFWDRALTSMPSRYWAGFQFSALRTDVAIATEMLGDRAAKDEADVNAYPFLTCEIGGGMMNSYHRRILVDPLDIEATTLIKIAAGSTMPGYYMYHGGTNPEGRLTTLMEAQDTQTTNYNDLPVKTYDFQAPLGEYGEVRPHYHLLRRLHLFLRDYGSDLATMVPAMPDQRPKGREDVQTLRWAARSDGRRGIVFLNNYERGTVLPPKEGVQFSLTLASGGSLLFPTRPVTIPTATVAWWPFNWNIGGITVISATAQPITHVVEGNGTRTLFFAQTPGVPVEFVLAQEQVRRIDTTCPVDRESGRIVIRDITPGRGVAARLLTREDAILQIVVLDPADSLALWKGSFAGRQRVILTPADVVFDHHAIRLRAESGAPPKVAVFPAPATLAVDHQPVRATTDGLFQVYAMPESVRQRTIEFTQVRAAGALRAIPRGPRREGVAMQPTDEDFAAASVWQVKIPADVDYAAQPLLRFNYVGDVARVRVAGHLVTDDFYNGHARDVGLWRTPAEQRSAPVEFAVLPLQAEAPIFLAASARPEFGGQPAAVALRAVELVETRTLTLTGTPAPEPKLPRNFRTDATLPNSPRGDFLK